MNNVDKKSKADKTKELFNRIIEASCNKWKTDFDKNTPKIYNFNIDKVNKKSMK